MNDMNDMNDKRSIPERECDIHLPAENATRGVSIWIAERLFRFEEVDFCWTGISSADLNLKELKDPIIYLEKVSEYRPNLIRAKIAKKFLEELDNILLGSF